MKKKNFLNSLKSTIDLSQAIADAKLNLNVFSSSKHNSPIDTLTKVKILLTHIDSLIKNSWLIPNQNIGEYSNNEYANLKNKIKDIIKDIDNTTL